jgi:hypothetical protein
MTPIAPNKQAANGATALVVERTTTTDMDDGQPMPPWIEDGIVWHIVRRADGLTQWRRISLSAFLPPNHRASAASSVATIKQSDSTKKGPHQ